MDSPLFPQKSMPKEYTPEMSQDLLKSLLQPIEQERASEVAAAQGSAVSRGLAGDPFEASAVGAANYNANTAENKAIADFGYNLAGTLEGERMTKQQQDWQATQNQKDRDFQEMLAQQGWEFNRAVEGRAHNLEQQGMIWGGVTGGIKGASEMYGRSQGWYSGGGQ